MNNKIVGCISGLVVAALVSACGGGGGGSSSGSGGPAAVDAAATASATIAGGTTAVSRDASITVTYSVQAGTYASYTGGITCGAVAAVTTAVLDGAAGKINITPKDDLPSGASCTASGTIEVNGANAGKSASVGWQVAFTTGATTSWWPPAFVPMGTKVYLDASTAPPGAVTNATFPGQTQSGTLPPACKTTGDACWKDAVKNGTIKFVLTTATDNSGRPMATAFYRVISTINFPGQNKMLHCNKPSYADTGASLVAGGDAVENFCVEAVSVYTMGNALGALLQVGETTAPSGLVCYQQQYSLSGNFWFNAQVTCP